MSPLPKRQLTVKEQILGEKKAKESTVKKLSSINSLIERKKINAERDHVVKEATQIIAEWETLWSRIHGSAKGAVRGDKEKIKSLQKRAFDLRAGIEQKAKLAEIKQDTLAQKQYHDLLVFINTRLIQRIE